MTSIDRLDLQRMQPINDPLAMALGFEFEIVILDFWEVIQGVLETSKWSALLERLFKRLADVSAGVMPDKVLHDLEVFIGETFRKRDKPVLRHNSSGEFNLFGVPVLKQVFF